ncbi:MAG: 50S ribosomal protein P1 [Candidatus Aenigmatarchaeota archaeon]|nr:50S ribosomal protein P1 [Candidatus Aenigmarchaeota archaeon]
MEYIYAALLLHSAKKEITEENLRNVLTAAGVSIDEARLKSLVESLKDINIDDVIKSASSASIPVQVQTTTQTTTETKAEEKKKEDSKAAEEQAVAGLAALFGF